MSVATDVGIEIPEEGGHVDYTDENGKKWSAVFKRLSLDTEENAKKGISALDDEFLRADLAYYHPTWLPEPVEDGTEPEPGRTMRVTACPHADLVSAKVLEAGRVWK